ncbi:MAG: hypothetical protein ACPL7K_05080 [Armatimonadota bacterium]
MRHFWLAAALLFVGSGVWCPSSADEGAEPKRLAVKTAVAPGETREYRIDAVIRGKAPSAEGGEPVDIDAAFRLNVRHRYSRREGDGLLPLEISLVEGSMTVDVEVEGKKVPQTLQIAPNIYPKLTVLIDRDWRINDIFGLSAERASRSFPGISYGNHIILFYPGGLDQPRVVGDKWECSRKIPALGETYAFVNTLAGEQVIDGVPTAVVRQEITRPAKEDSEGITTSMKATAESAFALDDGKLIKSHVDCDVIFSTRRGLPGSAGDNDGSPRQDRTYSRANIKIDISLVKR